MRISDWRSDVCSSDLNDQVSYVNQEDDAGGISTVSQSGRNNNSIINQTSNGSQASVTQAAADNVSVLTQGRSAGNAYQTNGNEALISQTGRRNQSYEIGRAQVCTPVTTWHLVCRLL